MQNNHFVHLRYVNGTCGLPWTILERQYVWWRHTSRSILHLPHSCFTYSKIGALYSIYFSRFSVGLVIASPYVGPQILKNHFLRFTACHCSNHNTLSHIYIQMLQHWRRSWVVVDNDKNMGVFGSCVGWRQFPMIIRCMQCLWNIFLMNRIYSNHVFLSNNTFYPEYSVLPYSTHIVGGYFWLSVISLHKMSQNPRHRHLSNKILFPLWR